MEKPGLEKTKECFRIKSGFCTAVRVVFLVYGEFRETMHLAHLFRSARSCKIPRFYSMSISAEPTSAVWITVPDETAAHSTL
jgi:hypothetical protein